MNRLLIRILALLLSLAGAFSGAAQVYPDREMRAVWLATVWGIDWPSVQGCDAVSREAQQRQLTSILEECERTNLTTVFFQVRPMADALYRSSLEPWSAFVSGERGKDPGWDPLAYAVRECHRLGLEIYAWVNPFRWSTGKEHETDADNRVRKAGWLIRHGRTTVFNPGLEEVRQHVVAVCREIVEGYDVDGLIFDDYFYPQGISEGPEAPDRDLWLRTAPWMSLADWRRANVHRTVADVYAMITDIKPGLRFGISPAGVAGHESTSASKWGMEALSGVKAGDWQYGEIYSDPLGWLYQGTVDFISPQIYWSHSHPTAPFGPLARWWAEAACHYGVHLYSSITLAPLSQTNTPAARQELLSQIDTNREACINGIHGTALYSACHLAKLAPDLRASCFGSKTLPPELTSRPVPAPAAPGRISKADGRLSWKGVKGARRYAVYAFPRSLSEEVILEAAADNGGLPPSAYLQGVTYLPTFASRSGLRYAIVALSSSGAPSPVVFAD